MTKPPRTELVFTMVLTTQQWDDLTAALSYAVRLMDATGRQEQAVRVATLAGHIVAARRHATRELMPPDKGA